MVKYISNDVVGKIEFSILNREYKMWVGRELYRINFPVTRRKFATLKRDADNSILMSYMLLNLFGKHKFDIVD